MRSLKVAVAALARRTADRLDPAGAPRSIGWSFTFERGRGFVLHEGRERGCPLWYLGEEDYERAHAEALTAHARVDWASGVVSTVGGRR